MGKLPLSVSVSAGVHVVLVGWIASRDVETVPARDEAPATTRVEIVDVPRTAAASTIEPPTSSSTDASREATSSLDAPREASSVATTTRERSRRTTASSSASGSTSTGGDERPSEPGPAKPGERNPYLDMRRGARPDLTLPGTRDALDRPPAGTSPQATRVTGQLAPDGHGYKSEQGAYVAKVDKDGRVRFKDRGDVSIGIAVPTPKQIGRGIAQWYESDKGPDGQRGERTLEHEVGGSIDQETTGCNGVRDNACSPDRTRTTVVPVFRGGFNPTDWIMRRTVGDPYASKKLAYLDATREERAQIGAATREARLGQVVVIIRTNLERAWRSTNDARERKRLLFELWDEIAEARDERSAEAEASRAARAQVIAFIRARLPQRDKDAYSASEIAALNARKQSIETFSPYE